MSETKAETKVEKRLVVVTGATGAQGGSVVEYLLKEPSKWTIRAVTRNKNSDQAVKLANLGVEVISGDIGTKEDLLRAFQGAHAVFALTNYWDETVQKDKSLEVKQGKLMADVAKLQKVKHFLWSGLPDCKTLSKGALEVLHYSGKHDVEKHIRKIGLDATYIYPGFYLQAFSGFLAPTRVDGVVEFRSPLRSDTAVPWIDIRDTGYFVSIILNNPKKFMDKIILMSYEYVTMPTMAKIYQQVTGEKAKYVNIPMDVIEKTSNKEYFETMRWCNEFGYYYGADLSETQSTFPQLNTWDSFLRGTKWTVPSK